MKFVVSHEESFVAKTEPLVDAAFYIKSYAPLLPIINVLILESSITVLLESFINLSVLTFSECAAESNSKFASVTIIQLSCSVKIQSSVRFFLLFLEKLQGFGV